MTYMIIATLFFIVGLITFPIIQKHAINKAIKKRRKIADLKAGRN